jgi:hydroxymethylpyrimidine/phosphomethylpyrimidine kinase
LAQHAKPVALIHGRVLTIAGSDSGGGAGVQADIKTVMALGGYALTAITALTAQDTVAVHAVHPVPLDFIRLQILRALGDPGADVIKTGMLGGPAVIDLVCDLLAGGERPIVVDPVMVAKGGQSLLADTALDAMRRRLIPLSTILTPNLPEAEALTGHRINGPTDMEGAGRALLAMGAGAVLMKGGHLAGDLLVDLLVTPKAVRAFENPRQLTRHTHGTGCTLASAIATGLAQQMALGDAVARAIAYVQTAIATAPGIGAGHGPLNHFNVGRPQDG